MPVVIGSVSQSVTHERVAKATVEARMGATTERVDADDLGAFTFPNLAEGSWSFVALDKEKRAGKTKKLKVPDDTDKGLWLDVALRETEADRKAGIPFFAGLLVAFALLVIVYVALHLYVRQGAAPLSETIPVAISKFEEQANEAFKAKDKAAEGVVLLAALEDIRIDVEATLAQREDLSEMDRKVMTARMNAIKASLAEDKAAATLADAEKSELPERIDTLRAIIKTPKQLGVGIWNRDPLRMIEVLLWALAGILVNKIMLTGWYLYQRRFYKDGIIMHVAHLVATPVMVLVVVFLLSLVSLKITLASSNELVLDLSDPRVMVAFSFLLGTIPWPLWNFIENTAEKFPSGINA